MSGFVLGFAIGIVIDQADALLGVPGVEGTYAEKLWGTIEEITSTNLTTLAVGADSVHETVERAIAAVAGRDPRVIPTG